MSGKYLAGICLLLLTSCSLFSQAQPVLPAERSQRLARIANDREQVDTLNEWAFEFRTKDAELSRLCTNSAMKMAVKNRYPKGRGDAYVMFGLLAKNSGNIDSAEQFYLKAEHIRDSIKDYRGVASCWNNLGNLRKQQGDYQAAIRYFEQGIAKTKSLGPDEIVAALYNNLGTSLKYLGAYKQAWEQFQEGLLIAYQLNDTTGITNARFNIADLLHSRMAYYDRALDSLHVCLREYQAREDERGVAFTYNAMGNIAFNRKDYDYKEALCYYQEAIDREAVCPVNDRGVFYKNRGKVRLGLKDYDQALEDFQISRLYFEQAESQRELAGIWYEIGHVNYLQANYKEAENNFQRALAENDQDPWQESRILDQLSNAQYSLGQNEKALLTKQRYSELQDSLHNNYQSALQKDFEVKALQASYLAIENKLKEEKNQRLMLYGIIGFIIFWVALGAAVLIIYFSRQKRRIAEQNELLAKQEVIDVLREKELEANYAWLASEEETRKRIGKELHDGLGSMLSMVKLRFSSIDEKLQSFQAESREHYVKANQLLDEACEKVRHISHEMSSAILLRFGLKVQLDALVEAIRDSGKFQVELSTHGLRERMDANIEINIYRIIQEAVNNIIKHAEANKVFIQVYRFDDLINVLVEDDGQGFDKLGENGGMGLKNMESRVHDLDGTLSIDSQSGKGTRINIDLPVRQPEPV